MFLFLLCWNLLWKKVGVSAQQYVCLYLILSSSARPFPSSFHCVHTQLSCLSRPSAPPATSVLILDFILANHSGFSWPKRQRHEAE